MSKWLRLTIYSYLTGNELLTSIALLSSSERELLRHSQLLGPKTLILKASYDSHAALITPFDQSDSLGYTSADSLEDYKWSVCTHALLRFRLVGGDGGATSGDQEGARGVAGMLQRVPEKYKR